MMEIPELLGAATMIILTVAALWFDLVGLIDASIVDLIVLFVVIVVNVRNWNTKASPEAR